MQHRIALGKLLYDVDGNSAAASKLLREALELAPAAEARYTLALIQLREGQSEEAIRLFSELVEADSSNAQARTQLWLTAYLQQGDIETAQSELKRATSSQPYYSAAFHGWARLYPSGQYSPGNDCYSAPSSLKNRRLS